MTPRASSRSSTSTSSGRSRQACGGDCAAQPLAAHAGRRADAPGDHAEEHPDDRSDRRRQDRNRAAPRAAGAGAVREGRGHQVHRGRLRRARGRLDHQGAGRCRGQDDARAGAGACATARAKPAIERVLDALLPKPRMLGFSTDEPAQPRDAETRKKLRDMLKRGEIDEREVEIEVRALPMGVEIMAPPGMEEMQQQLQSVLSNLGGNRTRTARVKVTRGAEDHGGGRGRQAHQRGGTQGARAAQCRAERHRVHRRDRQDRPSPGNYGRRRITRRRAARPAAAGRGLAPSIPSTARSRPITCCSSPRARFICPSPRI